MAERGLTARHDVHKLPWEVSEFPILCETCLGESPYVRMTKVNWDKECKICTRPFIVFRWKPGNNSRFKTTEICQTCAKVKNVCQTCLFDLQYGLPVEVRDKFLLNKMEVPRDVINRDFWAHKMTRKIDKMELPYEKEENYTVLEKFKKSEESSNTGTAKRNNPHICSFFVKGICARAESCPYRHELPDLNDESLNSKNSLNNIKDRFYGVNDPIAKKIMKEFNETKPPSPPDDKSITTLYIGGLTDEAIRDQDIQEIFKKFGEIKSVKLLLSNYCAFVTFVERESAEKAILALFNKLAIKGERYRLSWGRNLENNTEKNEEENDEEDQKIRKIQYKTELPQIEKKQNLLANIATVNVHSYPSMNPKSQGGLLLNKKKERSLT